MIVRPLPPHRSPDHVHGARRSLVDEVSIRKELVGNSDDTRPQHIHGAASGRGVEGGQLSCSFCLRYVAGCHHHMDRRGKKRWAMVR